MLEEILALLFYVAIYVGYWVWKDFQEKQIKEIVEEVNEMVGDDGPQADTGLTVAERSAVHRIVNMANEKDLESDEKDPKTLRCLYCDAPLFAIYERCEYCGYSHAEARKLMIEAVGDGDLNDKFDT